MTSCGHCFGYDKTKIRAPQSRLANICEYAAWVRSFPFILPSFLPRASPGLDTLVGGIGTARRRNLGDDQDQAAGRRGRDSARRLRLQPGLKLVMGITLNKLTWQRADQVIPPSRPSSTRERRSGGNSPPRFEDSPGSRVWDARAATPCREEGLPGISLWASRRRFALISLVCDNEKGPWAFRTPALTPAPSAVPGRPGAPCAEG